MVLVEYYTARRRARHPTTTGMGLAEETRSRGPRKGEKRRVRPESIPTEPKAGPPHDRRAARRDVPEQSTSLFSSLAEVQGACRSLIPKPQGAVWRPMSPGGDAVGHAAWMTRRCRALGLHQGQGRGRRAARRPDAGLGATELFTVTVCVPGHGVRGILLRGQLTAAASFFQIPFCGRVISARPAYPEQGGRDGAHSRYALTHPPSGLRSQGRVTVPPSGPGVRGQGDRPPSGDDTY